MYTLKMYDVPNVISPVLISIGEVSVESPNGFIMVAAHIYESAQSGYEVYVYPETKLAGYECRNKFASKLAALTFAEKYAIEAAQMINKCTLEDWQDEKHIINGYPVLYAITKIYGPALNTAQTVAYLVQAESGVELYWLTSNPTNREAVSSQLWRPILDITIAHSRIQALAV